MSWWPWSNNETTVEDSLTSIIATLSTSLVTKCQQYINNQVFSSNKCTDLNVGNFCIYIDNNNKSLCEVDNQTKSAVSVKMLNKLVEKITVKTQAILSAIGNSNSKDTTKIRNIIQASVSTTVKNINLQSILNDIASGNVGTNCNIGTSTGTSTVTLYNRNFGQLLAKNIISAMVKAGVVNEEDLSKKITQENPIAGIISAIGSAISGFFSGIFGTAMMVLIGFVALIIIIIVIFRMMGGSSSPQPMMIGMPRPAGQLPPGYGFSPNVNRGLAIAQAALAPEPLPPAAPPAEPARV